MKKLNLQSKLTGLALSFAILMTACSGGSSSSSTAPQNTTFTLSVSNKTDVDFTEISIEDGFTGRVLYSGRFNCIANQVGCVLFYTGSEFSGPVVLTFKDQYGHIVAAYDTPTAPGSYLAAEVSLWSTGVYLFDALSRRNATIADMSQAEIESRLDLFTRNSLRKNTVSHDDNYVDLAMYYVHKIQMGPLSLNDFLDGLAQRLINFEVADISEFSIAANRTASTAITQGFKTALNSSFDFLKSFKFISVAQAQNTSCSSDTVAFLTLSGSVAGGVTNAFPLAGTVLSTVSALAMNSCTNIASELNTIINQLASLQNSLDNLQNRMGVLTNFLASSQISTNIQEFSDATSNLTQLSKNYQLILTNNNVKSLTEYVKLRGGDGADALAITLQKDGYNSRLEDLIIRTGETVDKNYLLQVDRLTSQTDALISALDLLCNDPGPGSSIVKQRIQCNLVIATTTAKLIAAQTMAYKLSSETYDLLEAYPSEATRFGYDLSRSAAQNKAELLDKNKAQLNELISKYRNAAQNDDGSSGYYNVFNGISSSLQTKMAQNNCKYDVSGSPAISEWYRSGRDEYIETLCKDNQTPIKARYFLKIGDASVNSDSVANVLGVLVGAISVRGPSQGAGFEIPPYWNSGPYNKLALKLNTAPIPGNFSVNSNLLSREGVTQISSGLSNGTLRGDFFELGQQPYQSSLFKSSGLTLLKSSNSGTYGNQYSWFRYTDSSRYSYVFAVNRIFGIACLSGDCTTNEYALPTTGDRRIGSLSFKNGPQKLGLAFYNNPLLRNPPEGSVGLLAFFLNDKLMY